MQLAQSEHLSFFRFWRFKAKIGLILHLTVVAILGAIAGGILLITSDAIMQRWTHNHPQRDPACGPSEFIADRKAGYRVRPNWACNKRNDYVVNGNRVTVVTPVFHDSRGARVSSPTDETPDRVDMIAIGGSQVWGQGIRQSDTFSAILATLTGRTSANFGVSGTGGVSAYFELERNLELDPEWVIYGFWEDHLNRNVRYCANTGLPTCTPLPRVVFDRGVTPKIELPADPNQKLSDTSRYFATMAAGNNSIGWDDFVWSFHARLRQLDEFLYPEAYDRAPLAQKIDAAIFAHGKMAAAARARGAKLVVTYIPLYFAPDIQPADQRLTEAAKRDGYLFVDTGPALAALRASGESITIPGDGHLSIKGHRVVAEQVLCAMLKEHPHKVGSYAKNNVKCLEKS